VELTLAVAAPCVVPHVSQGRVILVSRNDTAPSSTVVQHGEELEVSCEEQYEFLASMSPVTCNNGTWTHIPKCEPARYWHKRVLVATDFAWLKVQALAQIPEKWNGDCSEDGS
jgi:hypothetical protein